MVKRLYTKRATLIDLRGVVSSIKLKLRLPLLLLVSAILHGQLAVADDSAALPAFDMSALTNIASSLGNPQMINLFSSLLNPAGAMKPSLSGNPVPVGGAFDSNALSDQDPNSISAQTENNSASSGAGQQLAAQVTDPLRQFGVRSPAHQSTPASVQSAQPQAPPPPQQQQPQPIQQQPQQQQPSAQQQQPTQAPAPQQQPQQLPQQTFKELSSSPISGLMSMLPGILPGLNINSIGGLGNLGGLGKLLGLSKPPQSAPADLQKPAPQQPDQQQPPQNQSSGQGNGVNAAQAVINQVLSAYMAGQIPSELIQLALSGRVPPQMIELALSGQVPAPMIQMIITGQVPMSTINAFLGLMQQVDQTRPAAMTATSSGPPNNQPMPSTGVSGQSRSLFEGLFGIGAQKNTRGSINVPTLIGTVPMRIPGLSSMRTFGQMVGGTISNVASLIPA